MYALEPVVRHGGNGDFSELIVELNAKARLNVVRKISRSRVIEVYEASCQN
jgi:hypothetical protein